MVKITSLLKKTNYIDCSLELNTIGNLINKHDN